MRKFIKNTEGAVTVFVTLLLVPAILVSGTAVDLARVHSARSILQDANQLAANSVLTQYNALLYDLYGLMGIAKDDPVLWNLLNDYIEVAVFGEELQDRSLGTLQIFYGSDLSVGEIDFAYDKNLRNESVLRRQIEEYMKFRGPVLIVKQFLDAFEKNNIREDTEVISKKLDIDSGVAALYDKYKELYEAIVITDKCILPIGGISGGSFAAISSALVNIRSVFSQLKSCYSSWESEEDPDKKDDYAAKYQGILDNISVLIVGGMRGLVWGDGGWQTYSPVSGLYNTIENARAYAENFKSKFETVVSIAREIDAMNGDLKRKVDELEQKLESGQCSEELSKGLTEKNGVPPMSAIERYRDILKWDDVTGMSTIYRDGGCNYIDNDFMPILDDIRYRIVNNPGAGSMSLTELASISSDSRFALSPSVSSSLSTAAYFAAFPENSITYKMPPGFLKFSEHPGDNREFFEALTAMINQPSLDAVKIMDGQEDETGSDAETKQNKIINALLNLVETAYTGLTNDPLGAGYINSSEIPERDKMGVLEIVSLIPQALKEPVVRIIQDPLDSIAGAGNYLLLLTYGTSMFSNYTTARPDSIGKSRDNLNEISFTKSITGVPISPEVNYFFQSEWEYLYSGHDNAAKNLNTVTRLLFLIRLVCNYIAVFSVSDVTTVVTSIRTAFAWSPPLGLILGELARAAFVAAETVIDIAVLRSGHKVPLVKSAANNEWVCSPSGVMHTIGNIIAGAVDGGDSAKDEKGLSYENYMIIFFIAKALFYTGGESSAAAEFAVRTGDLIEWNIINYLGGVNADESKMAEALKSGGRFRLIDMKTDFSITTTANMRMLFLSMPLARRGVGGVIPPSVMPVTVTDHRGY